MGVLAAMSLKGKLTLGAVALGTVAALVLLMRVASAPSMQTVQAGMDPAQAAKVTAALGDGGIAYELTQGGTAVAVESGQAPAARMKLAAAGIGAAGAQQPGFELLDKQKLGTSSFQQQVAYQRALEGQIAQTIGRIAGVGGAQVRLSLPKEELFTDEEKPATAAVLLGGGDLEPGAIKGIANLVASSVPGLSAKDVTITDAGGHMVWPAGDGSGSAASAQARYEARAATSVEAMLARTLGPDRAQVRVSAEVDADQTTEERLTYARRGTPLTSVQENETLKGGAGAGGAAGTAANLGGAAQAAGAGSNYRKTSTKTEFGVDKTVTRTRKAPGEVKRQSVSVLVDANVKPAPDLEALQSAVVAAVGARPGRDTVTVQAIPFAKVAPAPAPAKSPIPALPPGTSDIAKGVGGGIAALVFLFLMRRHLRRREDETLADEPSWLRELQGPAGAPVPALTAGGRAPEDDPVVIPPMASFEDPRKVAIEDLVEREPERVAAQLRTWITEDSR